MEGEALKQQGNQAFFEGRFATAADLYTQAIDLDPGNAVFYVNRAAARIRLEQFNEALLDADTAIDLKQDYGKAYVKKAATLKAMGRVLDAKAALTAGLKRCPGDEALLRELGATPPPSASTSSPASASGGGSSAPSPSAGAPTTATAFLFGNSAAKQATIHAIIRAIAALHIILYFAPFGVSSSQAYGRVMYATVASQVVGLFNQHGIPRFSLQSAQTFLLDRQTFVILFAVLFYMLARPSYLYMMVVTAVDLFFLGEFVYLFFKTFNPAVASQLAGLGKRFNGTPEFESLPYHSKRVRAYQALIQWISQIEIFIGVAMLLSFNILALVLYGQILKLRYVLSPDSKAAWGRIDRTILSFTAGPRCPGVVGVLYSKVRNLVMWVGSPPTPPAGGAGGAGGLASKCTIM